ncbi:MAG: Stk1 family PASTA domain-containing Ser/Thr kinase [Peptococcaceae bacterium]|nr:Stk1 family PASTA domain-containing Ser/Thr kinase [Peptococcaceae bacterium]
MVGRVLGGRYALGERLGGGGTAFVYKGRDSLLNRTVAVKVLNTQLTSDEDFVAKFRREAQAAASLSNPHIVGIYDVGQDGDIYYIVMEYVEGKTLKHHIMDKGPLDTSQALDVAMQIAEGLRHAHRHGVIHRDIKPHNILLTRDGQAKVADFGIARATTSSTLTQSGSLMGSVHYLSPEQARGGFTNERSDIYSLGVVLYEMITGQVPFTGDNVFSIGLKHLQESPRPPRELNKDIDPRLEEIVLKAMSKEQGARFSSADGMLNALADIAGSMENQTERKMSKRRTKEQAESLPELDNTYVPGMNAASTTRRNDMATKSKKKTPWLTIVSAAMLMVMLTTVMVLLYVFWPRPEVEVPNVVGHSLQGAEVLLRAANLSYTIMDGEWNSAVPANEVIRQQPEGGRVVRSGRVIQIVPSRGPELLEVPDIVGMTLLQAQITLLEAGFVLGQQSTRSSETVPVEQIIEQNPRVGFRAERDQQIDVVVSTGPVIVELSSPPLVGLSEIEVVETLNALGLTVGAISRDYNPAPYGTIIGQSPQAGERLRPGEAIAIVISRGTLLPVTVHIPRSKLPANAHLEISVEDREGRRVVVNRVVAPGEEDVNEQVSGIEPYRLIVKIDGRVDRDETIGRGGN